MKWIPLTLLILSAPALAADRVVGVTIVPTCPSGLSQRQAQIAGQFYGADYSQILPTATTGRCEPTITNQSNDGWVSVGLTDVTLAIHYKYARPESGARRKPESRE